MLVHYRRLPKHLRRAWGRAIKRNYQVIKERQPTRRGFFLATTPYLTKKSLTILRKMHLQKKLLKR